jgi:hypothetical protein
LVVQCEDLVVGHVGQGFGKPPPILFVWRHMRQLALLRLAAAGPMPNQRHPEFRQSVRSRIGVLPLAFAQLGPQRQHCFRESIFNHVAPRPRQ